MSPATEHSTIAAGAPEAYAPERHPAPQDLLLCGNEGPPAPPGLLERLMRASPECLRRYPRTAALEAFLAERHGVQPECVVVTAGIDDGLERACRVLLGPERALVLPVPTFEMIERYARACGATIREVEWWERAFPLEQVLEAAGDDAAAIAVVSPNNPTGAALGAAELRRLAAAVPDITLLVDLAYGEFADEDLSVVAQELSNAIVFRTLSKAWGLAGLRVGYAIAPEAIAARLRAVGHPYAVSGPSLLLAEARLRDGDAGVRTSAAAVRRERRALVERLGELGAPAQPSQANFVLARPPDARWLRDGLAGLGIAVRIWPGHRLLAPCLRITCPGDGRDFARLECALAAVLRPDALLFDLDGVLADVSRSYRQAIELTARSFGVVLPPGEIQAAKRSGNANNDWVLTHALLRDHGIELTFEEVVERFQQYYLGSPLRPGLRERETLCCEPEQLARLAARLPLGLVTGRPRAEAEYFLEHWEIDGYFGALVCMEDAPAKPDPVPLQRALEQLGARRAWMLGDSVDDVRAARAAGVVPLGIVAPGDDAAAGGAALTRAGAARVFDRIEDLEELLS